MHSKEKDSKRLCFEKIFSRYLYGNYKDGMQAGGRISYVKLFSAGTCFILAICINFMNLSTANASRRIKESRHKKSSRCRKGNTYSSVSR